MMLDDRKKVALRAVASIGVVAIVALALVFLVTESNTALGIKDGTYSLGRQVEPAELDAVVAMGGELAETSRGDTLVHLPLGVSPPDFLVFEGEIFTVQTLGYCIFLAMGIPSVLALGLYWAGRVVGRKV